jgi:phage-related protein
MTVWAIEFYVDARGRAPVYDFIASLSLGEQAAVYHDLDLLAEFGIMLIMPHARRIDDLWELRSGPARVFYVSHTGRRFILLHGYYKKGQKAPQHEIDTAKRRLADFMTHEGA